MAASQLSLRASHYGAYASSRSVALLIAASALGAWLSGCTTSVSQARANDTQADHKVDVALATVSERAMPHYLTLTGTLTANRSSQVAADGVGRVRDTFVERGSFVKQGDLLVRLDARAAQLSDSEARAQVEASRSQRDVAQRECERAERLFADRAIGQAEYDRLKAQCSVTQWSSEAAMARAGMANKALGDAAVRAPFSGMVVERFVSLGEYVRPGAAVAEVVEIDPLRLELTVPESEVGQVSAGQNVSFEVTAFPGERFAAQIARLAPAVRKGTRDLVVEAVVANPGGKLLPGMFALARIELARANKPVVPLAALRGEGSKSRLFAVVNGRLEERLVQLGEREGDVVAVEKGVRAGDRIAQLATDKNLQDGLRVE
jgi:membrane fusion protein (multidrug efflux system)